MGSLHLEGLPPGVGQNPPPTWDTMGHGQQEGGTHPTGMLSCFTELFNPQKKIPYFIILCTVIDNFLFIHLMVGRLLLKELS